MVFKKQICVLIYVNQNNGGKMNCLKRNLNIKNTNIKHFRITNCFLPPGNQANKTRIPPGIYC